MDSCQVCLEQFDENNKFQLKCQHEFCKDCLINEWENKINKQQVTEKQLICPQDDCNQPIQVYELKQLLDKLYIKKFEEYSFKQYDTLNDNEKRIQCPKKNCNGIYTIWKDADYTKCILCQFEFCTKCLNKRHDQISCEDADKSQEDLQFEQYMKQQKIKKCPVCSSPVELSEFCKFMTCQSNQCAKKTYFCYICGQQLNRDQHFSHYKDNNPYGESCKGYNKYEEKQKEKQQKLDSGQYDICTCETVCELIQNFSYEIFYCEKCKKYKCRHCKKEFKPQDEEKIFQHIGQKCEKNCQIF